MPCLIFQFLKCGSRQTVCKTRIPAYAAYRSIVGNRIFSPGLLFALASLLASCGWNSQSARPPGPDSLSACTMAVRGILDASDRDGLLAHASPSFAAILRRNFGPPGPIDFDPRFDTQDELPDVKNFGTPTARGEQILIPVSLVFEATPWRTMETSLTKTYVFSRVNNQWLLDDILSSGRETPIPGSFRSWLD